MNRPNSWLLVCAALIAVNVVAQVSPQYQDWGDTGVRYLMMKQEKTDWAALRTDAEAKAFIDLFWARRDPTPDTPVNELRQQVEARIAEANKRYGFERTPGSLTDRGLVYAVLGQPTQIVNRVAPPRGFDRPVVFETWIYRNSAAERAVGTKLFDIQFIFQDEKGAGLFELDGPSKRAFESTALNVAKSVLKRPFLTAADLAGGAALERAVPFRLIVVADNALAHDILRRAQEGENFSDLARKYSSHPSAQQGGYVGRVPFGDLTDDFKVAFAGKEPGSVVLIDRKTQFAVVRLLTDAEAAAADAEMPKPK
jgi:GWxTD domain-containing protein